MSTQSIAFAVALDNTPYEKAIELVTAALKTEGFGILTRIDVRATLKEKIDVDFRPYAILGACNPPLAHRALSHDAEVGLMLPCNVTVEATPAGGSMVRIADPDVFLQVGEFRHDKVLQAIAREARERLQRAVSTLNASK